MFRSLFKTAPAAEKVWNYANVHDTDTLKFSSALFDAMTELNRESKKVWGPDTRNIVTGDILEPTNPSYTPVQDAIQICVPKSGFIQSQLNETRVFGVKGHTTNGRLYREYTAADAVKTLKELQSYLNDVTPALAKYQLDNPATDAAHIQEKLRQCKGAVGDFITHIEQTFLPKQTAVGKGIVPQRAQLLQMRACLDAC